MNKAFEIALGEYGTKEIVGNSDNPEVLKYFHDIGHKWVKHDELAWCSAFVNWCCFKAKLAYSGKLNARSWQSIGKQVKVPHIGDIVVFWRIKKDSPWGHVAFFVRETKNYVYVLGGNQSNQVKISAYPKSKLLEYRRIV